METKGKKRGAARIRKVFNCKSQFGRSEAVQFARMGFFLNVTRRSSPVSPRFEPPLPPQPSFLPSFRSVQPRFARFRDSFVTKKLNSSRRDVHPPSLFPFSLALLSPSRPPFPSTVRVVSRPFSTALPAQFFGLATAPLSASFCTCQRQRLHTLDSSPTSLSPLLNGVGRPIYLPGSKDQTANLSIERMAWLVISARSVAFHARIKMQSRPSPLSRSTIPPTDRPTPSSFAIAICRVTFAFSLRLRVVDKWMRGREGIVLPALPILVVPRSNIDAREESGLGTWFVVFDGGEGIHFHRITRVLLRDYLRSMG